MRYVTHRNGDRLYISKDYPDYLEGYIQDEGNPYFFRMDYPPCKFRIKKKCGTCQKARIEYYCTKRKIDKYLPCLTCEIRES
jgi:hypothetical protein